MNSTPAAIPVSWLQPERLTLMKITFHIIVLLFSLTSCGVLTSDKKTTCNCCDKSFTNLNSAINCLVKTPDKKTSAEQRHFLFAFVSKDVKKYQELGWNIFTGEEIINAAKENYLLIIQDINKFTFPKQLDASAILAKIKDRKGEPYFVITNQALYPFSDWTLTEKKDIILDRLGVGIGP